MLSYLAERGVEAVIVLGRSIRLYATSPILLLLASVPTAMRTWQTLRGDGTPAADPVSETIVGAFRIGLIVAVVAMSNGWRPPLSPVPDVSSGTFSADWGQIVADGAMFALVFGFLNLVLIVATGGMQESLSTPAATARFAIRNALLVPAATIHVLWVFRLLRW